MPDTGFIPWSMFQTLAGAPLFTVLFSIGVATDVRDLRWALSQPALVARSLFSVLVLVPIVGVLMAWSLDISREAQLGIALMAIAPGAPIALRRSIGAGGHHSFAATLQLLVAALAIVSMPLSAIAVNALFGTHGEVSAAVVARQVLIAQLIPLGRGLAARRVAPAFAARIEPAVRQLGGVMLFAFLVVVLASICRLVLGVEFLLTAGVIVITVLALAIGQTLGGPASETRTAVAISSAL